MRRLSAVTVAIFLFALAALAVWLVSLSVQPSGPPFSNSGLLLAGVVVVGVAAVISGLNDSLQLVDRIMGLPAPSPDAPKNRGQEATDTGASTHTLEPPTPPDEPSIVSSHTCYISYSEADQDFAERLHADLKSEGVTCWFLPTDARGGQKSHEQMQQAIQGHDKLLLPLSETSMQSEWVKTQIRYARQAEVSAGERKLFPIGLAPLASIRAWEAFDADIGKDIAVEVREYFIPDFTYWKEHDSYQRAFQRLLRDLKEAQRGDRA